MLESIRARNKGLDILNAFDQEFNEFGTILDYTVCLDSIEYINNNTDIPQEGNIYVAHDIDFSKTVSTHVFDDVFGGIPIQFGYCNGQNTKLNALEYHKSSEINIAVTPLILLLGLTKDINNNQYDTKHIKVFYIPKNTVFEIHPKVLHFAPCKVFESGFKCAVILPAGTNTEFVKAKQKNSPDNQFLFKTNKWLLAHKECDRIIDQGARIGLVGENIEINFLRGNHD